MATTLNMTLLLRRAEFADSCVLQAGEPGYHTSTKAFKIGDGQTTWANLPVANETQIKGWISDLKDTLEGKITENTNKFANYYTKSEIDGLLSALESALEGLITAEATARQQADAGLQSQIDAKLATETFNTWKGTHENGHAPSATQIASDIAGAVAGEKTLREAADKDITDTLGTGFDKGDNTVAKKIAAAEAAAKAYAEAQAGAAQSAAEATAESKDAARAQAAATNLANAVSALETKITNGDSATLQSAKDYADEKVAAEAQARTNADNALDERLGRVEAFFEGADHDGETGGLKDALDTLVEIQTYIETEGAAADEMVKDIAQNASDIDALESRVGTAESTITSLGNNKLDKSVYETYINGKAMSDADLKKYAEDEADAAQSAAEAKAAELDTALHTTISKEIDADVAAAIAAEVTRSNAYADKAEEDAIATAASQADAKDATLHTTITGEIATAKSEAIDDAKDYTDAREVEIKKYADQAETDAVATAKAYTDSREVEIKKYADQAETDAVAAANSYADTQDAATLTAAKAYADEKVAGAVTKVTAGNTDIVVTPAGGTGNVTVAHKVYGTGTYTKPDAVSDANFVTGVTIENGHVTGASVKSLAEALSAMTFIFDGGTSANTIN